MRGRSSAPGPWTGRAGTLRSGLSCPLPPPPPPDRVSPLVQFTGDCTDRWLILKTAVSHCFNGTMEVWGITNTVFSLEMTVEILWCEQAVAKHVKIREFYRNIVG